MATPIHWRANGRSPIKVTAIKIVNTGVSNMMFVACGTTELRDTQGKVRQGVVGQNPAAAHNGSLAKQVDMALQRQTFTISRQQKRAHEKSIKGATEKKSHADGIVLHRFFLGEVIATQEKC